MFDIGGPIDKRQAVCQVMNWPRAGAKQSPDPMMTHSNGGYIPDHACSNDNQYQFKYCWIFSTLIVIVVADSFNIVGSNLYNLCPLHLFPF